MDQLLNEGSSYAWVLWFVIALFAGILEMLLPAFGFVFASIAGFLTAIISLQFNWMVQFISFSVILISSLALLRPRLLAMLHSSADIPSRTQVLIGKSGVVTVAIDSLGLTGRVLVDGQDWAAQSLVVIPEGQSVVVEGSDGIVLKVREI